ncbi:MAG TPA: PDZ domain-containing protein [Terriglobales bacterium]|nr:PDZ domain-containing protein [Terriglobales bacterium]
MTFLHARLPLVALAASAVIVFGQAGFAADRVHYTIFLANPEKHLVQITIDVPPGANERELQLPVWNALYQVRDFSQYMNWIRADSAGKPLPLIQLNKSRWKIGGAENGARVQYEMFSDIPGPYGAQVNSQHAFFNLAEILCYIEGERSDPVEVEFRNTPTGWKIATPLQAQGSGFSALNYDQLVDSPVEISNFYEKDFDTTCGKYRVIVDADDAPAIFDKVLSPIRAVVSAEAAWMHDCPFQNYMFIYHFAESAGGGGMEHSYGTAITLSKQDLDAGFYQLISITAHEFFHLWNVKRIRPQSLEPVDYTKENYTPALWFSEGVDSTVAEYVLLRAGLLDERHYLNHLGQEITELEARPAHLTQSAEQSSVDAWLEKYPYYNLPVRSISYYNKGELLGVLLDLKMRDSTDDRTSLEDLFRWMNEHYAKQGKFFHDSESVRQAIEILSKSDFRDFFQKYVSGVEEIPWDTYFRSVGLQVTTSEVTFADPEFQAIRSFDQSPTVVQVEPSSAADRAGLKAGDVILEINGQHAGRDFERKIAGLGPGAMLRLTISRSGAQQDLQWNLSPRKQRVFRLQDLPDITATQKSRRATWLFGNPTPPASLPR